MIAASGATARAGNRGTCRRAAAPVRPEHAAPEPPAAEPPGAHATAPGSPTRPPLDDIARPPVPLAAPARAAAAARAFAAGNGYVTGLLVDRII